jgi:DNA-binding beta-propeller fold protein YncE
VFDAKTMTRLASRAVCPAPHGVVTNAKDDTAFVACYGGDELAIVDLGSDGLPTTRVPLGATPGVPGVPRYGPYSATLTPDETRVVVADLEGKDVRFFDRATKTFVHTITLDAKAFMPAFAPDGALLVPLQAPDGVARIEGTAIAKRTTYAKDVCALPHVVRFDAKGRAYLVCEGDHVAPGAVLEIDPVSLALKQRWAVGAYPDGIAFGED